MHILLVLRSYVAQHLTRTERGASAVEYGLLVAGIAAVIVASVFLFGGVLNELMGESCGSIMFWVKNGADC